MNKIVKFGLSAQGIETAIAAVEEYQQWLKEKSALLLERMAADGMEIASARFAKAAYDGTNDVSVSVETVGINARAIVAIGASVLFIEFGTGVTYPNNHPEAAKNGMVRGGYGKGHGNQSAWGYYGEAGTNGKVLRETEKGSLVVTHGNPANMSMYETVKELKLSLPQIVREVFQ
jgi:hypothetical protein